MKPPARRDNFAGTARGERADLVIEDNLMAQWNPLHDLMSLQNHMNRLFEDATQRCTTDRNPRRPHGWQETESSDEVESASGADWYPAADVCEEDGQYLVAIDLPGIDRSTLDISIDDRQLTVKGVRAGSGANQIRCERPSGSFLKTFSVPAAVAQTEIKADYKDGVLQIRLPKEAKPSAQRIEIKVS